MAVLAQWQLGDVARFAGRKRAARLAITASVRDGRVRGSRRAAVVARVVRTGDVAIHHRHVGLQQRQDVAQGIPGRWIEPFSETDDRRAMGL